MMDYNRYLQQLLIICSDNITILKMGQKPGCCTTQPDHKKIGRIQVPTIIKENFPQPILLNEFVTPPDPYCPRLYGQFHYQVSPQRKVILKLPENNNSRTHYVWKEVEVWQYPLQKIASLPIQQIKTRTFAQKFSWFRLKLQELKRKYGKQFNRIKVDPTNVLLSSYKSFKNLNFNLQTKIVFQDDTKAIDAGGLFRQWVNMSIRQAFDPELGMFKLCQTDETAYKIIANKGNKQLFVQIAKILGFVIGKSLIQKIPLNCYLNRTILRTLANQPVTLSDFYNYDKQIYNSLKYILDNPISEQDYLPFYTKIHDPFTNTDRQVQLIPNGKNIFVNDQNKQDFVRRMIKLYCYQAIKPIIQQLKQSLYQVIPYSYLSIFQPNQLQMIICGRQQIDATDWRQNTTYKGYMPNQNIIVWFWQIVRNFDQTMRGNLLHYCTGSTKVPIQGFKFLQSKRGTIHHFTIKKVQLNKNNPYPKGITCFNRLELPNYTTKQQLQKMLIAICHQQINDFGLDNVPH